MFTIKDTWRDVVKVYPDMGAVYLEICKHGDASRVVGDLDLTPKKARKLAKALRRAAEKAKARR